MKSLEWISENIFIEKPVAFRPKLFILTYYFLPTKYSGL